MKQNWIKVDNLLFRIRICEEDLKIPQGWMGDNNIGEDSDEDESLVPSEWSEGNNEEDDWYVEDSYFEGRTRDKDRREGVGDQEPKESLSPEGFAGKTSEKPESGIG